MAWVRLPLCAVLLGGCLIVRTTDEQIEEPCPEVKPERLADAGGPFVIAGLQIYFIGANGPLSRMAVDGGIVSELTTETTSAAALAADATDLYIATNGDEVIRWPLDGSPPYSIAQGYAGITAIVVDESSVVWASNGGIDQWLKADQTITHLDDAGLVLGLGAYDGVYYYSMVHENTVRRAPPVLDLATAQFPGPLAVDDRGVYFYEVADPFVQYAGAIRLVPREGGELVTTAPDLLPVIALAEDDTHLYFVTAYGIEYRVKRVSRFGGVVRTLACGFFQQQRVSLGLVTDSATSADYIYWADDLSLYRIDKTAGDPP